MAQCSHFSRVIRAMFLASPCVCCVMMMTETASPWCTSPLEILSRQQQQQEDDESYVDSPATLVVRTVGGSIYPNINLCGCSPLQPHAPLSTNIRVHGRSKDMSGSNVKLFSVYRHMKHKCLIICNIFETSRI